MRRFAALLAIVIVACKGAPSSTDAAPPASATAPSPPVDPFESYRRAAKVPTIAFAAVNRDATLLEGATGAAADGDAVFQAASIAKTVVATCVMQLVEDRRLDLDADVSGYVGFRVRAPKAKAAITLRMLLSHTSSITDHVDRLQESADVALGDFLVRYLARPDAYGDAAPGAGFAYSNVGVALAAYAVERASGVSFAEHSTRRVFEPLAMTKTRWRGAAIASFRADPDGGLSAVPPPSHAVYPVVDLRSTTHDLARWARMLLRDGELDGVRILSPASVTTMMRAVPRSAEQGLGFQLRSWGGRDLVGHEGEDAGASTALFLDLAAGTGVILLANGDAFASNDRTRATAMESMLTDLFARAVAAARPPVPSAR